MKRLVLTVQSLGYKYYKFLYLFYPCLSRSYATTQILYPNNNGLFACLPSAVCYILLLNIADYVRYEKLSKEKDVAMEIYIYLSQQSITAAAIIAAILILRKPLGKSLIFLCKRIKKVLTKKCKVLLE